MAIFVLGEQTKKRLETSQFFNNTVKPRIKDLSADIEKQLVLWLKSGFVCSLQIVESTDMSGLTILLICKLIVPEKKTEEYSVSTCADAQDLPFSKTHQCEAGFSWYALTKSKYRCVLDVATDMTIQLSTITSILKDLVIWINCTVLLTDSLWGKTVHSNSDSLLFSNFLCQS